jgi:hypothetical protein
LSHIAQIELQVNDLDALKAAAEKLGLIFREGQRHYRWYGRSVGDYPLPEGFTAADLGKCDHALSVRENPGAYEVGVVQKKDGSGFQLLWDFWNRGRSYGDFGKGLEDVVGENACKLQQEYAVEVAKKYWLGQGWQVTEDRKEDGTVQLNAVQF